LKRAKQRGRRRGEVVDVVELSPALREVFVELQAIRPPKCLHVFPTRDDNAYADRGFKSLWNRIVLKAIADGVLAADARFTFHDLRAY
jgi:integrase